MSKKSIPLAGILVVVIMTTGLLTSCKNGSVAEESYKPTWRSLKRYPVPQWVKDGKFGIYTHWGVYSVPAMGGPDGTSYPGDMYREDSKLYKHHVETYGSPSEFGYKEFIPMFQGREVSMLMNGQSFSKRLAQKFAGPVAEHQDGFAMWDYQALRMETLRRWGPKRDVVGELEKGPSRKRKHEVRKRHSTIPRNGTSFRYGTRDLTVSDPKYSGLYGQIHETGEEPNEEYLDEWSREK